MIDIDIEIDNESSIDTDIQMSDGEIDIEELEKENKGVEK